MAICVSLVLGASGAKRDIRVGVFPLDPLNYMDEEGAARGFNPDLLRAIALERGDWNPVFIPVTWSEGLQKLQDEQLDLMLSVTRTERRAKVMDFSNERVLEVWGQVYVHPDAGIESVLDLEGRLVGVMRADINGKNFIKLADAFGIHYEIVEYDTHEEILVAAEHGAIDACVLPSHYGLRHAPRHDLVGTSILFSPAPVFFAAKKGRDGDVLNDIDTVLKKWKADERSFYYACFENWFGTDVALVSRVPFWIWGALGATLLGMLLLSVFIGLSKRQIIARTSELSDSEERYRLLVENHTDLVVKVDLEKRFLYVSPSYCDTFGKSEASLLGNTFMPLVHEEDQVSTATEFAKVFEPPHRAYMEQRALTKNGWRWLAWEDSGVLDERGNVVEIIGVGRDVTERKAAEQARNESVERLRLATDAAKIGIWEYDFARDELIWDDQMFKLYGMDPDSFEGTFHAWRRRLLADDLEATEHVFQRAVEEGALFEAEFRVLWDDESEHCIKALAEIERDPGGRPIRAIGTNWDVTRRRRMVAALTESERDYRQLFENMTTGFMMLQAVDNESGNPLDFRVTQVNRAAEQLADGRRSEMIGRLISECFDPLEDGWIEVFAKVARTGRSSSFEGRMSSLAKYLSVWIFVAKPGYLGVVLSDDTARRAAEDAILRARQELEHIIDNTKDVIFQIDPEGNYIFANAAAREVSGYAASEILTMNMFDLILPEYHETTLARLRRRLENNPDAGNFTFEIRHKEGHRVWLELATSAVYGPRGELESIQGVARDVTQRKEFDKEIEESRRFLRTIIDTIPARVFWKDLNSTFLGSNIAFAKDSGLGDPEELVGKNDYEMSWGDTEAEQFRADDKAVMDSGVSRVNFEEVQTRPDGRKRWLSTSKVPIRDAGGEIIGVLGAYQDITERKALGEERARLFAAINQSTEAIVIIDVEGVVKYVNPAFETVTGRSKDDSVGQHLAAIKSGRRDDEFFPRVWSTIERGESRRGLVVNQRAQAFAQTVEVVVSPVRDGAEQIVNHVMTIRDVSKQVELEEHVRHAQKMDAVGRLAGGVAHDFNNILQSILGFSGMLIAELAEGTPQHEDAEEIRKAARRAADLTRQLLTLSRKHDVLYAVLDLNEIIRRNEKMARRLFVANVEFVFDLRQEIKPVRVDASQIEQIILNLFINARDAMPNGGRLVVRTRDLTSEDAVSVDVGEGDFVCLTIADTGSGIRDDVLEHLFEPFFTTKKVGEGTGLGLSVVYGIVQQHGGWIDVESKVGEGATFRVYLPARDRCEIAEQADGESSAGVHAEGRGESILVVEDDPVLRELSERLLRDAGYEVVAASNRKEAEQALGETAFDLLLMNVVLPDGNGLEIAREAKVANPGLSVLLCSGHSHSSSTHDAMKSNDFRYLEKPVGTMLLLQTTREMLDEKLQV